MMARVLTGRWGRGAWEAPIVLSVTYGLALLLLLVSALIDLRNSRDLEATSTRVTRTLEAMEKVRQIGNTFYVAETSQRGYIITGNAAYLEAFGDMRKNIPLRLAELGGLLSATETQQGSLDQIRGLAASQFDDMQRALDVYRTSGQAGALAFIARYDTVNSLTAVREVLRSMLEEESRILAGQRAAVASSYRNGMTRALVSTTLVGLALTAFFLLTQRFLRQRDAALRVVEASNAELEQRVIDRTTDLSHLSRHLLNVREHEKKVIARDLHDDFGSYLTAINMDVSRARDKIAATNPEQARKLERTLGLLGSAIEMKRQLISDLRPSMLDNLGLGAAIEQYIDEWSRRTGIAATFDYSGALDSNDEGCPIAIFRVFQEALSNVARHSQATRVAAHAYRVGDEIEFEIADDGIGLNEADRAKPGVHGLLGIRERVLAYGGRIEIGAGRNGGTLLRGAMPCIVGALQSGVPAYATFA